MRYKFEIQAYLEVEVEGETKEQARLLVVDALSCGEYDHELSNPSAYVSDDEVVE